MTKLSVNINKLATLRNSRGKNNPDVVAWAREIEEIGADGITVHPRPDERHIRRSDVLSLAPIVRGEFNIEGYPDDAWLKLVEQIRPAQATLVPDPPEALTSDAGWRVKASQKVLEVVARRLKAAGVRMSVFIDPRVFDAEDARILRSLGVSRIELFTERWAETFAEHGEASAEFAKVAAEYKAASQLAQSEGLALNAGHDLNLLNLPRLVSDIPALAEVSIGHALICDALRYGFRETVHRYKQALTPRGF